MYLEPSTRTKFPIQVLLGLLMLMKKELQAGHLSLTKDIESIISFLKEME
jgi:hypothetical protein